MWYLLFETCIPNCLSVLPADNTALYLERILSLEVFPWVCICLIVLYPIFLLSWVLEASILQRQALCCIKAPSKELAKVSLSPYHKVAYDA
jgi:hypothetical protein